MQISRLSSVESFFKAQVSSSSNIALFLSVMKNNSSVLFWSKHNMLLTKVAYQSANFQTSHCSHYQKSVFLQTLHHSSMS